MDWPALLGWAITTISLTTQYIVGRKNKWGHILGASNQFLWAWYGILKDTSALVFLAFVFFCLYIWNFKKWHLQEMHGQGVGFFDKYIIRKRSGITDPNAVYFALRLDTDANAREAALLYAKRVEHTNEQLAKDLNKVVKEFDK